jgi:hypothetical protein
MGSPDLTSSPSFLRSLGTVPKKSSGLNAKVVEEGEFPIIFSASPFMLRLSSSTSLDFFNYFH